MINWLSKQLHSFVKFRRDVIRTNSGMSSKSYVMVMGMRLTRIIIYWYLFVLTIEMFTDYVLRSNWLDFVAVIAGLSTFVLSAAYGKIKGEQAYWKDPSQDEYKPDDPDKEYNEP